MYALCASRPCKTHAARRTSKSAMFSTPEYGRRCAHLTRVDGRLDELANIAVSSSARKGSSSEGRLGNSCFIFGSCRRRLGEQLGFENEG